VIRSIAELEHVTSVAPLGLRFRDDLSGQTIADGLSVSCYPPGQPQNRTQAQVTRGGVYVLRNLPGLRAVETGRGDADFWARVPASVPLVVEVVDTNRRFIPFSLRTAAPVEGVFTWLDAWTSMASASPLAAAPFVPLFSAPSRLVPGGIGVIRAELVDPTAGGGAGAPAAGAVLEVDVPGMPLSRSIADAQGRVVLLFPYPVPPAAPLSGGNGSPQEPPGASASALRDQTWTLAVRAAYAPNSPTPELPDLADTLSQPSAVLWADQARTQILSQAPLRFGRETVLTSQDTTGLTRPSVLFIQAGSPL